MNNYRKHFDRELTIMRSNLEEGDQLVIEDSVPAIEKVLDSFGDGHSGGSAPLAIGALSATIKNTLLFKPLSPLYGDDSEWNDVDGDGSDREITFQNNRCGAVFKTEDGPAYYLDAIVFVGETRGDQFTGTVEGIRSRQNIEFPFRPKTFYVDVYRELYNAETHGPEDECRVVSCGDGEYVYFIKDYRQLEAVAEYYQVSQDFLAFIEKMRPRFGEGEIIEYEDKGGDTALGVCVMCDNDTAIFADFTIVSETEHKTHMDRLWSTSNSRADSSGDFPYKRVEISTKN
ncbi:MAG: hypothetical protein ACTSPB_08720 [Candidatus Thorarchaeota archaeon]